MMDAITRLNGEITHSGTKAAKISKQNSRLHTCLHHAMDGDVHLPNYRFKTLAEGCEVLKSLEQINRPEHD